MTRVHEPHTPALLLSHADEEHTLSDGQHMLRLTLRAVYLTGANEVRNFIDDHGDQPLANLQITAQYDGGVVHGQPYGWETRYRDLYDVDLRSAEAMVKTLRKVERGLERLQGKWGYPESFAAYVVRVADVLGIEMFGWQRDGSNTGRYDDNVYHWTGNTGLQTRINTLVYEFDRAHPRTATNVGD